MKSKFFGDYGRIGSFLSDPRQFQPALLKLEQSLLDELNERLRRLGAPVETLNRNDYAYLSSQYRTNATAKPRNEWHTDLADAEKAVKAYKKLLTGRLAECERRFGFSLPDDNRADLIVGLPSAFNDLLRARRPFKDLGAGKEHGEYSHRIQWYLICNMGTLQHPPAEIYEKLPGWYAKDPKQPAQRAFYMWEFLVDRDGQPTNAALIPFKTKERDDFRAPSNVNRWLTGSGGEIQCPLLHATLTRRWTKREEENILACLARKLYRTGGVIDDETFDKIRKVVEDGIVKR